MALQAIAKNMLAYNKTLILPTFRNSAMRKMVSRTWKEYGCQYNINVFFNVSDTNWNISVKLYVHFCIFNMIIVLMLSSQILVAELLENMVP